MNREDVIRMAQEVKLSNEIGAFGYPYLPELERFAALVASVEREECANICETLELPEWPDKVRQPLAQAIRARGDKHD